MVGAKKEDQQNLDKGGFNKLENHSLKADLHVHSKYSKRPSEWVLQKIGCAESYTEPEKLYQLAKQRGMDLVTITDHNTLAGSLEIAHLESTFVSEEITTYFPEDRCKIHVLAFDINENQHKDVYRLRENIYDLASYLDQEGVAHALAHPMFSINGRLTINHFEQLLVLFKNFELNGAREGSQNRILVEVLGRLTEKDITLLADKHNLVPVAAEPWRKNLIGGSDDHSSLNIANMYTQTEDASTVTSFLDGIARGRATARGKASEPKTMAHTLYSIAYQFYKTKFSMGRYVNEEPLLRFADHVLIPSLGSSEESLLERLRSYLGYRRPTYFYKSEKKSIQGLLKKEAREIIFGDPKLSDMIAKSGHEASQMQEAWFLFVDKTSERALKQFADSILESLSGANVFDVFNSIGSAASLYTMLAPYFVAYTIFTKDRSFCLDCGDRFSENPKAGRKERLKVAHFTDTFHDVNGVARTLQMQVDIAHKNNKELTLITCGEHGSMPGVKNFLPIGTFDLPEYSELKLFYPPLLRMLDYCYEKKFTHIHSATPGPIGLAALAIARILNLPLCGTYHTALPQYADQLTEDPAMGAVMWRYVVWYYNQMDVVYVPSHATGDELVAKGISKDKIRFYARGIDTLRFHPAKRNGFFESRFGLSPEKVKLLYVGRVSKEKNLPLLAETFRRIVRFRNDFHLVVVGEGPYLDQMRDSLRNLPATFTGFLTGEDLPQVYASSDLFLFPSTTDTFGNVVLEAQASGLPVIVSDRGGPQENLVPEKTGLVVPADDSDALTEAVMKLTADTHLLKKMGADARNYMEHRCFESAFLKLWDSYRLLNAAAA
jgi:glycosyltransferase involved in cell wall biosynthesis